MGEEVLSPTSPNASRSPPQHQIKLSQSQAAQGNNAQNNWAFPSQRPTVGGRNLSQEKEDNKSRWPGLNVVTNFSKPPSVAQRAVGGDVKQNAGLGLKKQAGGSLASSRKASVETLGLGHQPSNKSLKTFGSKGRIGNLKRASSKWSNLSPSDRAVVIGISVSPEELAHHSASPEASPLRTEGLSEQHAIDRHSSIMPIIVVTPAKEKAPWSAEEEESAQFHKSRAASSVYSQAPTHNGARVIDSAMLPPIPPLPPDAQEHNAQNRSKEPTKKGPPPRIMSGYTEIDDGESPEIHDEKRPGTGESQLRILTKSSSMDTIATKHRSQGWWNTIVSPFFPKSPMTFKTPAPPKEPVPGIPTLVKQDRSLQEARQTFPPPPDSDGLRSGHTSWTDSTIDADYEKRPKLDEFRDRSTMIVDEPQENMVRESALLPTKLEGFGAAAEYYEACLYDMHSTTPYFECQNHTCSVSMDGLEESTGPRGVEGNTLLGGIQDVERQAEQPLAAQQAPTNRFSAAFHEAVTPKSRQRPQSDATVIEDLDGTPDVQEAQAASVVRAPAPIPTAQPPPPNNPAVSEPMASKAVEEPPLPPEPNPQPAQAPRSSPRVAAARAFSPPPPGSTRSSNTHTFSPHLPGSNPRPNPDSRNSPSKQERQPKRYVAVLPPESRIQSASEQPLSPEPLSPTQQRQAAKSAIPLEDVRIGHPEREQTTTADLFSPPRDTSRSQDPRNLGSPKDGNSNEPSSQHASAYPGEGRYYRDDEPQQTTVADLYPPPRDVTATQRQWQYKEKDALPPRVQKKHQPLTFPRCKGCISGAKPRNKKEKKIFIGIAAGLILLIILVLVLVMTLTLKKKGNKMPIQAQWLNLTNFPPIPTGVATIIQPNAVDENPDCIHPGTMWSCAVPKEQQQSLYPSAPNQPNFRVEISFQNGTNATANTTTSNSSSIHGRSYGHTANAVSAGGFIRNRLLYIRNTFSGNKFTPSPAAPNLEEQIFLGNTTERNAAPFDGEFTPFFMSFESASKLSSRMLKRQNSNSDTDSSAFPNATSAIPAPDSNLDGTAAAANLYPYSSSQPLRLFDRGLDTEHYGFYTYFDRSIFLKSAAALDPSSSNITAPVPDDEDGGTDENAASVRCTWAQTRFLVQIWTKKGNSATILQSTNSTSKSADSSSTNSTTLTSSSANDFTQPGSFPYPVSITLDRHGGDITKKMVYCYGLDDREHFNSSQKQFQLEDRAVGGQLVNPALGPFADVNVTIAEGGPGGIDGGSGGCACRWQNFDTGA